jgi:hypothetical protein
VRSFDRKEHERIEARRNTAMSVYLMAQLKIKEGGLEPFVRIMWEDVVPKLKAVKVGEQTYGWDLIGQYLNVIGTPNPAVGGGSRIVLDIWELTPDLSAWEGVYFTLKDDPEYMAAEAELAKYVEEETMQIMYKLPEALGQYPNY